MFTKVVILGVGLVVAIQVNRLAQSARPGSVAGTGAAPAYDPIVEGNRGWDDAFKKGRTGDRLLGEVSVAGDRLPWDQIVIAVKCNGETSYATTTDPKGFFIIARPGPADATKIVGKEKSFIAKLAGCTVSAMLPGFNSSELTIANRDLYTSPNIGTIKLTREDTATDPTVSSTTALAPKNARKSFEKARNEWLNKRPDRAQQELKKALDSYPQFAEAWYQLGRIQAAANSPDAFHSFTRAAEADANFALPYEQMATISAKEEKWQELLEETNRALELNPAGNLDVWHYHALGNYHLKKMDLAEKSALKSLSMDPLHLQPGTEQLLAVILAEKNDKQGALEHLRKCLTYYTPGPDLDLVKQQIARLETPVAEKAETSVPSEPASNASTAPEGDTPETLDSDGSCRVDEVLPKVTLHVEEFVKNVDRFTATEVLQRERRDHEGNLKDKVQGKSNYVATIQKVQSKFYVVSEYRDESKIPKNFHGTIAANVAPALVLIFHPSHIEEYYMTCKGPVEWSGHDTWKVDFRQRIDRPATMSGFEVGNKEYTILLKGSAWIDRTNYQIVHMESDLVQSIPEMRLDKLHQSVDYGSVAFRGSEATLWLPQIAEVTADYQGKRLVERHTYSEFQIFSIDTQEKISQPTDSPN